MRSDVQVNWHNNTERKLQSHDYLRYASLHPDTPRKITVPHCLKTGQNKNQYVYANTLRIYGMGKDVLGNWKDRQNGKSQQGQPVACARY